MFAYSWAESEDETELTNDTYLGRCCMPRWPGRAYTAFLL